MSATPFRAPTAVADTSPPKDSLIAQLRATAAEERADSEYVAMLPGRWDGVMRVVYGYIDIDELESYADIDLTHVSNVGMSLDMMSKAVKRIEAHNSRTGKWETVEDANGPVTFDDRLARLLAWPRPDDDWEFSVRQVYEGVFEGNGVLLGKHMGDVSRWMGLLDGEEESGKDSTSGGSTPSPPPQPSA